MDEARQRRAAERAGWPGLKTTLAAQPDSDLVPHGTPGERVAMVDTITRALWASSGQVWPTYPRDRIPGVVHRPSGAVALGSATHEENALASAGPHEGAAPSDDPSERGCS
jgi:hypothetical protein